MNQSETANTILRFAPPENSDSGILQSTTDYDVRNYQVVKFMRANLHRNLSNAEIAGSVNLSPSHLRRLFKTEVGVSLAHYHKRLKLEKAAELLINEMLTVKEIMNMLGVNDVSHFMRDFKKAYGLSPAQFRTQYQKIVLEIGE